MYTTESKKRRPRFSNAEIAMLVNEVYRNKEVLFSKKCSTYSNEQKSRAWQAVTDSINAVCVVEPRTPDEVRRKWYYYLSDKKKEAARQKHQKKTSHPSRNILYSPSDLKILEILGEIEGGGPGEADDYDDGGVEGLICEVDADALPLRSPSSSCSNGDLNTLEDEKFLHPEVSLEEEEEPQEEQQQEEPYLGDIVNGFTGSVKEDSATADSESIHYMDDYHPLHTRATGHKRHQRYDHGVDNEDDDGNSEFLQLEKRRIKLQEIQLQVLQDIHKQLREDSERNRVFQVAFLEIQRQKMERKAANNHKS